LAAETARVCCYVIYWRHSLSSSHNLSTHCDNGTSAIDIVLVACGSAAPLYRDSVIAVVINDVPTVEAVWA